MIYYIKVSLQCSVCISVPSQYVTGGIFVLIFFYVAIKKEIEKWSDGLTEWPKSWVSILIFICKIVRDGLEERLCMSSHVCVFVCACIHLLACLYECAFLCECLCRSICAWACVGLFVWVYVYAYVYVCNCKTVGLFTWVCMPVCIVQCWPVCIRSGKVLEYCFPWQGHWEPWIHMISYRT